MSIATAAALIAVELKPTRAYRRKLALRLEHNPYSNRLELCAGITIGKQHESVAFATAPLKEWTLRIDGDCRLHCRLHVLGGGLFSITLGEFTQIEHLLAPHGLKVVRS